MFKDLKEFWYKMRYNSYRELYLFNYRIWRNDVVKKTIELQTEGRLYGTGYRIHKQRMLDWSKKNLMSLGDGPMSYEEFREQAPGKKTVDLIPAPIMD